MVAINCLPSLVSLQYVMIIIMHDGVCPVHLLFNYTRILYHVQSAHSNIICDNFVFVKVFYKLYYDHVSITTTELDLDDY